MKKINYLVLMAAMLLLGTNVCFGTTYEVASAGEFTEAWGEKAKTGDIIKLTDNVTLAKTVWLGTETLSGTPRSIEIDLAGNELSSSATYAFLLTHGSLKISNSGAFGEGKLIGLGTCTNVFYITGSTNKDVDPSVDGADYFTHLEIAEGVIVQHDKYDGAISIDGIWTAVNKKGVVTGNVAFAPNTGFIPSKPQLNYITNVYANGETVQNKCVAHGVRVDVKGTINGKKYGIKSNGYLGNPTYYFDTPNRRQKDDVVAFSSDLLPEGYKILATDIQYSPYIYVYPTARITVLDAAEAGQSKNPVGIYAAGYARWKVEGYAEGCNGAVIKSGQVDFTDATVIGTGPVYEEATASSSGTTSSGSGIVVASTDAYAGGIEVSIGGDTEVSSQNGYALEEVITTKDEDSKVEVVEISGGSFEGSADQGSIKITDTTVDKGNVEVTGGQIIGGDPDDEGVVSIGGMSLTDFLVEAAGEQGQTHVTITTNEDGDPVMVIVSGGSPKGSEVLAGHDGDSINWKHSSTLITTDMSEDITENLTLEQLQITQKEYDQTVTVKDGVTLEVGSVVLGERAKIIVEPGATFKVTKKDGIYSPKVSNLILQTQAGKPSIFLFNPAVTTNAHPNATVEFTSTKSFRENATNKQYERFGLPTWTAITSIECDQPTLQTSISIFGVTGWDYCGILEGDELEGIAKLNKPFIACELLANTKTSAPTNPKYTFTGKLTGNGNATLNVDHEWTPFANSYSARIDAAALIDGLAGGVNVDQTIYLARSQGHNLFTWDAIDLIWGEPGKQLEPMEAFILHNHGTSAEETSINYNATVWTPATSASPAPRRSAANDFTAKLRMIVESTQGDWDNVKLSESATNSHNADKYMNDNMNLYAHGNENKLAIVASENLEGTYFGFSTVVGGVFKISFADVEGREFELIDLETGAKVTVEEGNTYMFTASDKTTNDYRFKLVGAHKVPTAVDAINGEKNQSGVYTMLGQYVGEMNQWNTLPAGVYVVNGEKRVK